MKVIVIDRCCKAEELKVSEKSIPEVIQGWVLVKIHAVGMNHSEAILRMYEADRDYIHTPIIPGIECAGEIADASDSDFKNGDKVVALMGGMGRSFDGSYAEYTLLPAKNVFMADTDLDWLSLAALPETYSTAYGSLKECLLLSKSDTLLVRGATSTVGQAAIQLAKAMGAYVIAACRRESSFDQMIRIGADECVKDYKLLADRTFENRPNKILELVGPKTLYDSLLTVSHPGYVCNTGILGNVFTVEHFDPIKYVPNGVFLSGFYSNYPTQQMMDEIFSLISKHHLKPLYKNVFTLDEIAAAHALLEKGSAGGKLILNLD